MRVPHPSTDSAHNVSTGPSFDDGDRRAKPVKNELVPEEHQNEMSGGKASRRSSVGGAASIECIKEHIERKGGLVAPILGVSDEMEARDMSLITTPTPTPTPTLTATLIEAGMGLSLLSTAPPQGVTLLRIPWCCLLKPSMGASTSLGKVSSPKPPSPTSINLGTVNSRLK